jgi:serine/threonine protein kinase
MSSISDQLLAIKTSEKLSCDRQFRSLENDNSPRGINRKTQCAMLNMKELSAVKFGNVIGTGMQGSVNKFSLGLREQDSRIPNINHLRKGVEDGDIIIKSMHPELFSSETGKVVKFPKESRKEMRQSLLNSSADELKANKLIENYKPENTETQKLEGLVGLKLNLISHLTPNFPYYYDIRHLTRDQKENYSLMEIPFENLQLQKGNYGIIFEMIKDPITFGEFLDKTKKDDKLKKQIPDVLLQILFTSYIGVKELGLVHFDLHERNILITKTEQKTITYTIPLTPRAYKEIYGDISDSSKWNLERNYWILDDSEDEFNFVIPEYQNQNYARHSIKNPRFKRVRVGDKYHQEYKHFSVNVQTHGLLVKIVDFGFASMYSNGVFELNEETARYVFKDIPKPPEPYIAIDTWRYLMFVYETISGKDPLEYPDLYKIFGDYVKTIKTLNERKEIETTRNMKYINYIPTELRDNDAFMNRAFVVFNNMNNLPKKSKTFRTERVSMELD